MRPRTVWRLHLAVLLVYAVLAVLLTWPTATHPGTHLPGDGGDDPAIAWNLWWVKHALLTMRSNPLFSSFMFYPIGINLAFYTLTTLNALTALPVLLNLGVVAASNLHTMFSMVVAGYGAFLLARYILAISWPPARQMDTPGKPHPAGGPAEATWHGLWLAAAIAGGFYAFASSQLFYVSLGQFNVASSHWVPYAVLFVLKSGRDLRSLRWPALAALFLAMQAWAEMTYASFLILFIGLYVAYGIITPYVSRARQRPPPITHLTLALRNLILMALLFALGISPLLAAMLPDMRAEGDFWVQGSGFAEVFSADLAGFLVPTMRHPLFGEMVSHTGIQNLYKGQHIFLGFVLLILAAVGLVAYGRRGPAGDGRGHRAGAGPWFWLIASLGFAWLALGPSIHVNGIDTHIPGPFAILQTLPFFKGNRYPSRFSGMLVMSLSMLAALGMGAIWQQVGRWREPGANVKAASRGQQVLLPAIAGLVAALFLFEHLSAPLPQSNMSVPDPYRIIAAESGDFTLLDIPVAWRNGFRITGPIDPGFMFGQFYQTAHARPLLQGNTSRNPEFKFQYFTQAPLINSILALETGHDLPPERWEADRAIASEVLRFFGTRFIVVRPGPGEDPAVTPEATLPYIEAVMPVARVYGDSKLTLYRVNLPPLADRMEISASAPLAPLTFGEGWGALPDQREDPADQRVWAQRRTARLFVPLGGGAHQLTLRLSVPEVEGAAPQEIQRLTLRLGDWRSAPLVLRPGPGEYTLRLPAEAIQTGLNEIQLEFDRLYPAASLSGETAGSSGSSPSLLVQSAGEEVGDFAHIYVDGVDVSPNARGYNVAAISPTGEIQAASFDTHLDPDASTALAAFIAGIPQGHTVVVAAADEASQSLGEEGVAALRSIGAAGDLRGKFRWSHALIGRKGSEPGSALEALDGLRPAGVARGPALSEPTVAAALEWARFEALE